MTKENGKENTEIKENKPKKSKLARILDVAWRFVAATLAVLVLSFVGLRSVIYLTTQITTENGIDEGAYIPIGGLEQYVLIRGENTNNPVIIWLHGGPANPDTYMSYTFSNHLVDNYTVVVWDQRGCGRTYYHNKDIDPENQTATFEQSEKDLDELVNYIRGRFGKDKVILVGHSYGTVLGIKYVKDHSDKVSAYVGVGQFINSDCELISYEDALRIAKEKGKSTVKLEKAYEKYKSDKTVRNLIELRTETAKYHKAKKKANTFWIGLASPYMSWGDFRWVLMQNGDLKQYFELNSQMFDYLLNVDVRDFGSEYGIPVGFISGSSDWVTPVKCTEEYYDGITAPKKDYKLIDGCGHSPQIDQPEEFGIMLEEMLASFLN